MSLFARTCRNNETATNFSSSLNSTCNVEIELFSSSVREFWEYELNCALHFLTSDYTKISFGIF